MKHIVFFNKMLEVDRNLLLRPIIAGLSIVLLISCSSQLDLYPSTEVSPGDVTEKDLPALERGMYNRVQNNPTRESYILFDILGGMLAQTSGNPSDLINSTLSPLSSRVTNGWDGYFKALYQANNLISITDNMTATSLSVNVKGEAHYFRAYIYYCLVTRWGAVPILRDNTMDLVGRDSVADVWAFIEEDLETAISLLGASDSYYYVSKDAALALKARVMLSQGKMSEAANVAESLITSGTYRFDAFEKIFRKQQNTEIIFAFENLTQESNITISAAFYSYAHPNKGSWVYRPTRALMDLYDDADLRKSISITSVDGNDMVNKYPSGQTGTDPVIISRIAEMYLISAEAQGRSNGLARLNELREARGLADVNPSTDTEFMDAILLERKKEFLGENFLFYDLVRTGRAQSELGILAYQQLLPIPGDQLLLNPNLEPNPGYN
ncbi:MAG: RagB/SusD family nutrient uptake outer membrane protein [Bacteroidales bacterium]